MKNSRKPPVIVALGLENIRIVIVPSFAPGGISGKAECKYLAWIMFSNQYSEPFHQSSLPLCLCPRKHDCRVLFRALLKVSLKHLFSGFDGFAESSCGEITAA